MIIAVTSIALMKSFSWNASVTHFCRSIQESEDKAVILNELHEGVLVYAKNGKLLFSNNAAWDLIGDIPITLEDFKSVLRTRVRDVNIFTADLQDSFSRIGSLRSDKNMARVAPEVQNNDEEICEGHQLDLWINKIARKDSKQSVFKFECIYSFIEELRQDTLSIEVVVRRTNFGGQRCICVMINDISKMKEVIQLKGLDHYKDMLLASVTHELRTPLNCIIPMIEEVIKDSSVPNTIRESCLNPAYMSAKLLLNLINDILDLSRMKRNNLRLNLRHFNVVEHATEIMKLFELQCRHKGLQLSLIPVSYTHLTLPTIYSV
eukprot:TRINITY_DN1298_c0_g4_i2.p1 TRINITY_DN1298_c0_g4~~TRINITY_DN1298_c0_g4_i2.p1  ORF type:complete len:320 (-),score=34.34 TRINITY_DN1298_c0_g4_i2:35-994(-)